MTLIANTINTIRRICEPAWIKTVSIFPVLSYLNPRSAPFTIHYIYYIVPLVTLHMKPLSAPVKDKGQFFLSPFTLHIYNNKNLIKNQFGYIILQFSTTLCKLYLLNDKTFQQWHPQTNIHQYYIKTYLQRHYLNICFQYKHGNFYVYLQHL